MNQSHKDEPEKDELDLAKLATEYGDNDTARAFLESLRWPAGAICPHCQSKAHYILKPRSSSRAPVRKGVYKCKDCRKQFSVTVGTIFEDSKVPLGKWLMAFFIIGSSKKGISAHQLHRMLGVTYKTAWFMNHRIRHAVSPLMPTEKLKGTVEADEAYFGVKNQSKQQVVALIERGGDVRAKVVSRISHRNFGQFMRDNIAKGTWPCADLVDSV